MSATVETFSRSLAVVVTAAALGSIVVSALALLAESFWLFELLTHFRLQYLAVQLPLLVALLWRRRWGLSALLMPFLGVNAAVVMPYVPRETQAFAATNDIELMTVNLYGRNERYAEFLDLARRERPDVVLLLEYTDAWAAALEPLADEYPHRVEAMRQGAFGIALFSRLPLTSGRVFDLSGVPAIDAQLGVGGQDTARLLGVHFMPPTSAQRASARNTQLDLVAELVSAGSGPLIVAGDFNMAPYSPLLADWLARTRLRDARHGRGFGMSWPTFLPLIGIPIDHFFVSADFLVAGHYYGPAFGSDHYPVMTRLSLRGKQ